MPSQIPLSRAGALALGVAFVLLLVAESLWPLRKPKRPRPRRWAVNLGITGLSYLAGTLLVRPTALMVAAFCQSQQVGLLALGPLPFWVQFALGFLWMDLSFYWWHRANHVYPLLWRFHNVHHVDPDMDVTTAFRFHFGETLYSTGFRLVQVGLMGVAPFTYLVYEAVFNLCTLFHHSNLRLPLGVERLLNRVIVTPRMHGLHHSAVGGETNSNYSVVLRWWDALHWTLCLNVPQSRVVIGVPAYLLPADNRFFNLVTMPFVRQRPYWRWPSGKASLRKPKPSGDPRVMLA